MQSIMSMHLQLVSKRDPGEPWEPLGPLCASLSAATNDLTGNRAQVKTLGTNKRAEIPSPPFFTES